MSSVTITSSDAVPLHCTERTSLGKIGWSIPIGVMQTERLIGAVAAPEVTEARSP